MTGSRSKTRCCKTPQLTSLHPNTPHHTSSLLITPHHHRVRGSTTVKCEAFSGKAVRATLAPPPVHRKKISLSALVTRTARVNADIWPLIRYALIYCREYLGVQRWDNTTAHYSALRRTTAHHTHRHCVRDLTTVRNCTAVPIRPTPSTWCLIGFIQRRDENCQRETTNGNGS